MWTLFVTNQYWLDCHMSYTHREHVCVTSRLWCDSCLIYICAAKQTTDVGVYYSQMCIQRLAHIFSTFSAKCFTWVLQILNSLLYQSFLKLKCYPNQGPMWCAQVLYQRFQTFNNSPSLLFLKSGQRTDRTIRTVQCFSGTLDSHQPLAPLQGTFPFFYSVI